MKMIKKGVMLLVTAIAIWIAINLAIRFDLWFWSKITPTGLFRIAIVDWICMTICAGLYIIQPDKETNEEIGS